MTRFATLAAFAALTAPVVDVPIAGPSLRAGAELNASTWARLPHVTVTAVDHDGRTATYEGLRLAEVLRDAGTAVGDAVRGSAARTYVLVTGADGYGAVFATGELDTAQARCAPLAVEGRDGAPLSPHDGPVQIVAPCDRTHARWVRNVASISVVVAPAAAAGK